MEVPLDEKESCGGLQARYTYLPTCLPICLSINKTPRSSTRMHTLISCNASYLLSPHNMLLSEHPKRRKCICNVSRNHSSSHFPLPKSDFNTVPWRQNDIRLELSSAVLPIFAYSLEALKHPYNCITYTSHYYTPCSWILGGFGATYPFQSMQIAVQYRFSARR